MCVETKNSSFTDEQVYRNSRIMRRYDCNDTDFFSHALFTTIWRQCRFLVFSCDDLCLTNQATCMFHFKTLYLYLFVYLRTIHGEIISLKYVEESIASLPSHFHTIVSLHYRFIIIASFTQAAMMP